MSPRKKARISRGIQYAVLVVILVAIGFTIDYPRLADKVFNLEIIADQFPDIITVALKNTLLYTALGFSLGLALGLLLALMRLSQVGPYRWLATAFIEFFRGVPAIIVFLGFSVGLPLAFNNRTLPGGALGTATIALGLVGAAYMAETIRAGLQAVPKGQMEAARSLGMSNSRAMISIIIPQGIRIVLPPLTNELILLTKDSSLIFITGLAVANYELTAFGRDRLVQAANLTPLVLAAALYLVITVPLSIVVRRMEANADRAR